MKIAVIGVGAMGSVYAALLADAGNEVWAIDTWKEHLDAIRQDGLRVEGASGDRIVTSIHAVSDVAVAGACDLYIIATKASGVEAAARAIAPVMGKQSLVLRSRTVWARENALRSSCPQQTCCSALPTVLAHR
jgi:2-dehydropantoate 2-reductase